MNISLAQTGLKGTFMNMHYYRCSVHSL